MARPRKNNADYFTHDNNMRNDPKIRAIRKSHGMTGYAVWCMLLEVLTSEDDFEYKVDEVSMEIMAGDFDIEVDDLNAVIESFSRLKLIQYDGSIIKCEHLNERMQPLLDKRARKREWAEQNKPPENSNGQVLDGQNPQSKVKESKVKESKVKESKEDITTDDARENEKGHREKIGGWLQAIRHDGYARECFTRSRKIPAERFDEFFDAFELEAKARPFEYHKEGDLTSHFLNFSGRRHEAEQRAKKAGPAKAGNGSGRAKINRLGENPDAYNEKQAF